MKNLLNILESQEMTKELEALQRIKNIPILSTPESTQKIFYDKHKKELDLIETTLIDYEETDNQIHNLFEKFGINNRKDLLKQLKALESIKGKTNLTKTNDGKKALVFVVLETEEEFDLLKRALL